MNVCNSYWRILVPNHKVKIAPQNLKCWNFVAVCFYSKQVQLCHSIGHSTNICVTKVCVGDTEWEPLDSLRIGLLPFLDFISDVQINLTPALLTCFVCCAPINLAACPFRFARSASLHWSFAFKSVCTARFKARSGQCAPHISTFPFEFARRPVRYIIFQSCVFGHWNSHNAASDVAFVVRKRKRNVHLRSFFARPKRF